ncbi:MAG: carboxypeptidase-like regulatory domain-containing protein [Saprospiraceae bacterium]|nr:carboxypeptidase-like regulatory domain-containing protein [Saprospiraceae bacterium]
MRAENKYQYRSGFYLSVWLLLSAGNLHATDVLERTIQVQFQQTPLKEALAEIARQGGFEWSYNANILEKGRTVTLVALGWTVRETLLYILGSGYTFKQSGEYLILKKQKKPQQRLSGYISDQRTGQRMANVTVYDRKTLRSTTTDQNGYYELPVSARSEIVVSKLSYRDTLLQVSSQTPRLLKLDLVTDTLPHYSKSSLREEVGRVSMRLEQFFVGSSQKFNARNVRDSLHRYLQVSFLPVLGTNHRLSGSVINDWSANLLAGYSRGNRILELAGIGNITRADVSGFQAGGAFNVVGGRLSGVQAAGVFNNLIGNVRGVQLAGVYNFAGDSLAGAQLAGVTNIASYTHPGSVQSAGVFNFSGRGKITLQVSGGANYAHEVQGAQIASVINTADTVHGGQVAAVFNRARYIKGIQVGLINVAQDIDGVQIGLINLSKRGGYVALEASANDVLLANAAFKSGVPGLYTILTGGLDPQSPDTSRLWAFGAGIGSRSRLTPWAGLSVDLLIRHLNEGNFQPEVQEWGQLAMALELNLGRHISIAGGPSANLFVADPVLGDTGRLRNRVVGRDLLGPEENEDGWLSAWWGWTAAVRVRF